MKTSTSQKIGSVIFAIGAEHKFGLGWLYSWRVVPAANQFGSDALPGFLGLSVPLGTFIVAIGAALAAKVERRVFWLLILLLVLSIAWGMAGTSNQMIPPLFGVGGGLITLFFIGSVWNWAKTHPMSSVTDMARFMIAHLQGGFYGDASSEVRILEDTTARQMHSTLYTPDPQILGTAYGFFDYSDNGQRTLGHSGGTLGFTTLLLLLPDQNLGVYVVYNHNDSGRLTTQHFGFQRAFFDHYYPAPAVEPIQPPADFKERASRFADSYRSARRAYTNFEKFGKLMLPPIEISDPGDGTLLLTIKGREVRLVEVEPLYFCQTDGPSGIVFREDDRGRITRMFIDVSPEEAYEKLNWYETARFNLALLLSSILVFLSMIPVALVRAIRNHRLSRDRKPASRGARIANWTIVAISVLNLLFVVGVARMFFFNLGFPMFGVSLFDRIMLGLGVLSALLTVGALVYAVLAWKDRYWSIASRVYYTLVTVAAVAFVWFLNQWNLLGWRC